MDDLTAVQMLQALQHTAQHIRTLFTVEFKAVIGHYAVSAQSRVRVSSSLANYKRARAAQCSAPRQARRYTDPIADNYTR